MINEKNKIRDKILDVMLFQNISMPVEGVDMMVEHLINAKVTIHGQAHILNINDKDTLITNHNNIIYAFTEKGVVELENPNHYRLINDGDKLLELLDKFKIFEPIYDFIIYVKK